MSISVGKNTQKSRDRIIIVILLILVLLSAGFLRLRGLFWGEYQYLHPDERFLVWVGTDISPVESFAEYWDTANSSLNPHNQGHGFYVYGTLPLYMARYLVEWVYGHSGFNEMTNAGRSLSALVDLLTVLLVFFIGSKVYNQRVGLLAAALSGFAVLQIQQAHFFTVDSFTTFFSVLAIYFAVLIAYDGGGVGNSTGRDGNTSQNYAEGIKGNEEKSQGPIRNFLSGPLLKLSIGFGVALGMAVSSKISAAPLAILLPAAFYLRSRTINEMERGIYFQQALGYLVIAGFISLLVFRVFQPMAFSGPGFFGLKPNSAWIANLRELQNQASGDVDFPPALQWARRPIWFAWQNMVEWGMGIPMGVLAWTGFLWVGLRILRGDWKEHILLWGWTAIIFTWQSLIFNPSMRYQLPIYPLLAIFAAWPVFRLWDWGKLRFSNKPIDSGDENISDAGTSNTRVRNFKFPRILAVLIGLGVLVSAAVYAYSFSNIYTRPITRVEASRWIYQNIPGPITLPIQVDGEEFNQQIPYPYSFRTSAEVPYINGFTAKRSGTLSEIHLGRVIDPMVNYGMKEFRVKVSDVPGGGLETADLQVDFSPGEDGVVRSDHYAYTQPIQLINGNRYFISVSLPPGQGPMKVNGQLEITIHGDQVYQQVIPLNDVLVDSINAHLEEFSSPADGILTALDLSLDQPDPPTDKTLELIVSDSPEINHVISSARLSGNFDSGGDPGGFSTPLDEPFNLEEGKGYYLTVKVDDPNAEIFIRGTPIANEGAWDDGLPVRLDGYDGFAGIYEPGLNFDMYEDDNQNKLARFFDILDHSEYLLISSSRQWANLPRLPERFPMNSEYYRRLLGCPDEHSIEWCYNAAQVGDYQGDLGFELVQVFQSNPEVAGLSINDQPSEEAFTVYDHPKVFIFQKETDYDPEIVRQILGSVDLTKVQHITPKRASELPKNMMLPADRLVSQLRGGTWAELFDIDSILNRSQVLGTIAWYLAVAFLGFVAYPILRLVLPGLADRGYPLSRIAGLLLFSYLVWMAGSFKIPFTRTTITIFFFILASVAGVLAFIQRDELQREWRSKRKYFLIIECLFLAFFLIDLLIRLGNPDLWHPWKGGEKPMDFSYLNAVLKSTTFPPYDPWFSGGYINYYYYGFTLIGVLVKWLGIVPSVAYNLILPTIFSMIALGAFSIGSNLFLATKSDRSASKSRFLSLPFIGGISAALGMAVLGNLGTIRMIYQGYQRLAAPGGSIEGANFILRFIWSIQGAFRTLTGESLPYGIADWYWLPSRVIPAPNDVEPITEFPFFTVLYGDPHAHLFALPLALLALAWGLSVVFNKGWRQNQTRPIVYQYFSIGLSLLFGGLVIGALRPTNTWDFPVYLGLGVLAVGYSTWKYHRPETGEDNFSSNQTRWVKRILFTSIVLFILGAFAFLLYQPYANWYVQGYTDISIWKGTHTPFASYLTHWGVFLFPIFTWLVWETREWMAVTPLSALRRLAPYRNWIVVGSVIIIAWILALIFIEVSIAWFVIPLAIWAVILIFRPGISDAKRVVFVMIAAGLILTLMVEVIVLVGDIGRMNTVFKFYLQVWTLLAIGAALGFTWILEDLPQWSLSWRLLWQVGMIFLVTSAALYPLLGGTAKIKDRMTENVPLTLDGMAFMQTSEYDDLGIRMDLNQDYQAIRWLQENVTGSPVIIEGHMVEYHWGTRFTIYTGLPGVIGWNNHQRQQRARAPEDAISDRISDVNEFYLTNDLVRAKQILDDYGVKFVIVGQLERALYPGSGLEKFDDLNGALWDEVFRFGDTVIYQTRL